MDKKEKKSLPEPRTYNEIILPWFGFQSHIFPPMSNVSYELTETFACLPQVPFPLCIYCVHFPGIVL